MHTGTLCSVFPSTKCGPGLYAVDLPVRLALGETHVIALTKAALGDAGVDVGQLESAAAASGRASAGAPGVERSSTVLLVKNLPYSATQEELQVTPQRFDPQYLAAWL